MDRFWSPTLAMTKMTTSFPNLTSASSSPMKFASLYLKHQVTYTLWLTVPPVLLLLGCFGNVMTIVVMRGMRASESTACLAVYFTALAVSDLFLLGTTVVMYWPEMAFDAPVTYVHDLSCSGTLFLTAASSMTSAWLLVAMSGQRLLSVVSPHRVRVLCTVRRGKVLTAAIGAVSCAATVHFLVNYHVVYLQDGYKSCVAKDQDVVSILGLLTTLLLSFIPFLFLTVTNAVLIYHVVRANRFAGKVMGVSDQLGSTSRSSQLSSMTVTLITTSAAFLLLTLPSCVFNLYLEGIGYFEGEIEDEVLAAKLALGDTVCILLWASNSAINFYIYILSGRKFRREVKRYFCPGVQSQTGPEHTN